MRVEKLRRKKFRNNILICIIALIIVIFVLDYAPGFRRDKYANKINIVIDDEDLTEKLQNDIFIEKDIIYLAKEDICTLFDKTIYYDKENKQIITTSSTKIAILVVGENKITVNNSTVNITGQAISKNNTIYLPISEMEIIYNIDFNYIRETNRVVIDSLNKELVKADISNNTKLKYKPRSFSKTIDELEKSQSIVCFKETINGWTKVRTLDGKIGYVKENKIANKINIRENLDMIKNTKTIKQINNYVEIEENGTKTRIALKKVLDLNEDIQASEVSEWIIVSDNSIQNEFMQSYISRTDTINKIVNILIKNNYSGANINISKIENVECFIDL